MKKIWLVSVNQTDLDVSGVIEGVEIIKQVVDFSCSEADVRNIFENQCGDVPSVIVAHYLLPLPPSIVVRVINSGIEVISIEDGAIYLCSLLGVETLEHSELAKLKDKDD